MLHFGPVWPMTGMWTDSRATLSFGSAAGNHVAWLDLRFSPAHEIFRAIRIIPESVARWTHLLNDDAVKHYQELGWSYHITVAESTMDSEAEEAALWTQLAQQWNGVCARSGRSPSGRGQVYH